MVHDVHRCPQIGPSSEVDTEQLPALVGRGGQVVGTAGAVGGGHETCGFAVRAVQQRDQMSRVGMGQELAVEYQLIGPSRLGRVLEQVPQ